MQATEKGDFTTVSVKGSCSSNNTPVHNLLDKGPHLVNVVEDLRVLAGHAGAELSVIMLGKVIYHATHISLGKESGVPQKILKRRSLKTMTHLVPAAMCRPIFCLTADIAPLDSECPSDRL